MLGRYIYLDIKMHDKRGNNFVSFFIPIQPTVCIFALALLFLMVMSIKQVYLNLLNWGREWVRERERERDKESETFTWQTWLPVHCKVIIGVRSIQLGLLYSHVSHFFLLGKGPLDHKIVSSEAPDFCIEHYSLGGIAPQMSHMSYGSNFVICGETVVELLPKKCFKPIPLQGALAQRDTPTYGTETLYSVSAMWGYNHAKFHVDWWSQVYDKKIKKSVGKIKLTNTMTLLRCGDHNKRWDKHANFFLLPYLSSSFFLSYLISLSLSLSLSLSQVLTVASSRLQWLWVWGTRCQWPSSRTHSWLTAASPPGGRQCTPMTLEVMNHLSWQSLTHT